MYVNNINNNKTQNEAEKNKIKLPMKKININEKNNVSNKGKANGTPSLNCIKISTDKRNLKNSKSSKKGNLKTEANNDNLKGKKNYENKLSFNQNQNQTKDNIKIQGYKEYNRNMYKIESPIKTNSKTIYINKTILIKNKTNNEGNSIAHLIAGLGDVKWLKHMIKKFNVNCFLKNNKGNTPFIHAILNENTSCVEYFIELFKNSRQLVSTNINWRNKYGQTPLHAAVFTGNCRIIEVLLRNKADISVFDANELTPYHYAYIEEREDVIKTIHETLGIDKFDFIKK